MRDADLALDALVSAVFLDGNPFQTIGDEATNLLAERWHDLDRDTPAKVWWQADATHPAIARALRVDAKEYGAAFALAPFRLSKVEDRHVILAAWPTPRLLGPFDWDWLGIISVIAWDPVSDSAHLLGDNEPQLIGEFHGDDSGTIYGQARAFFTDWMRDRAAFFVRWCQSRQGKWAHGATETDLIPGKLAIGDLDAIRWRPTAMPADLTCVGIDASRLNRLLLKSARIPRARNNQFRAAA